MKLTLILFTSLSLSLFGAQKNILFIGDSLTEGYGISKKSSYPNLLAHRLKDKGYKVINAGVSGSTTATGVSRLRWFGKKNPEVVVIALGSNDGLRGVRVSETKKNLKAMIKFCQDRKMKIVILATKVPVNYGTEYREKFDKMFLELSKEKDISFMPFLLKDVASIKELNQEDGIHPNEKGHEIMAKNIYPYILKVL